MDCKASAFVVGRKSPSRELGDKSCLWTVRTPPFVDDYEEAWVPMSYARELLASRGDDDKYMMKLAKNVQEIAERRLAYLKVRDQLKEVLDAFEALGADTSVDLDCTINVRIAGDKETFVKCWKLWRSIGVRLTPPSAGATEVYEHVSALGVRIWFHFTSTVCKRVQVGTKMVATAVYEVQCGESLELSKVEHDES
jgi:hypothetical protein